MPGRVRCAPLRRQVHSGNWPAGSRRARPGGCRPNRSLEPTDPIRRRQSARRPADCRCHPVELLDLGEHQGSGLIDCMICGTSVSPLGSVLASWLSRVGRTAGVVLDVPTTVAPDYANQESRIRRIRGAITLTEAPVAPLGGHTRAIACAAQCSDDHHRAVVAVEVCCAGSQVSNVGHGLLRDVVDQQLEELLLLVYGLDQLRRCTELTTKQVLSVRNGDMRRAQRVRP